MKRFALICAAAAGVIGLAICEAHAIPPTAVPQKPLPVVGPKPPPSKPTVNPWKFFNGNTAVAVFDPLLPKSPKKAVATFNLRNSLNSLFDNNVADIRNTFLTKLADKKLTGHRLYNTKVSIASSSNAYLQLGVFNSKSFGLCYVVPGNQIDCRIDINNAPDHSMRVRFHLELTIIIDASRGGGLTLRSATMRMTNVKVAIGSSLLFDSAAQARKAEAAFSRQTIDATRNVRGGIDLVNAKLRSYVANPLVSASFDGSQLVLTLSPARPVVNQGATSTSK